MITYEERLSSWTISSPTQTRNGAREQPSKIGCEWFLRLVELNDSMTFTSTASTPRGTWLDGSSKAISLAKELKTGIAPEKTLAIMCALTSDGSDLVVPRSPTELGEQIDWTPPSLYLFDPGGEPWADSGAISITRTVRMFPACSVCFVMEFRARQENELRRTFVAVA
jgi:hypothetical protein